MTRFLIVHNSVIPAIILIRSSRTYGKNAISTGYISENGHYIELLLLVTALAEQALSGKTGSVEIEREIFVIISKVVIFTLTSMLFCF